MRSLHTKEALAEKEQKMFLLIKMFKILDNCIAWPTSILRKQGEKLDNKSIQTKFWVSYLENKII
jgi:hypothetical protein